MQFGNNIVVPFVLNFSCFISRKTPTANQCSIGNPHLESIRKFAGSSLVPPTLDMSLFVMQHPKEPTETLPSNAGEHITDSSQYRSRRNSAAFVDAAVVVLEGRPVHSMHRR